MAISCKHILLFIALASSATQNIKSNPDTRLSSKESWPLLHRMYETGPIKIEQDEKTNIISLTIPNVSLPTSYSIDLNLLDNTLLIEAHNTKIKLSSKPSSGVFKGLLIADAYNKIEKKSNDPFQTETVSRHTETFVGIPIVFSTETTFQYDAAHKKLLIRVPSKESIYPTLKQPAE